VPIPRSNVIAGAVVLVAYPGYLANNPVAPVDRVYAATIKAGALTDVARQLLLWAVPARSCRFERLEAAYRRAVRHPIAAAGAVRG
jgi:hypothetical protein